MDKNLGRRIVLSFAALAVTGTAATVYLTRPLPPPLTVPEGFVKVSPKQALDAVGKLPACFVKQGVYDNRTVMGTPVDLGKTQLSMEDALALTPRMNMINAGGLSGDQCKGLAGRAFEDDSRSASPTYVLDPTGRVAVLRVGETYMMPKP